MEQISWSVSAELKSAIIFASRLNSTFTLFLETEIGSVYPSSVTAQAGLSQTLSKATFTGFLMIWLKIMMPVITESFALITPTEQCFIRMVFAFSITKIIG